MTGPVKALLLHGPHDLRMCDEPEPVPGPGEVLLRVTSVGICGSDLTWFESSGIGSARLDTPLILGHEFAAVAETGQYAGQRVAVDPADPCGVCRFCVEGHPNLCLDMRFAGHAPDHGALREKMAWPEKLLHPLPDSLSNEDGVLLEPLGVALHAMDLAKPRLTDTVGVFGCGPIGLMLVQLALASGASRVIAVDPLEHRLQVAENHGAEVFVPEPSGPMEPGGGASKSLLAACGQGLDIVFEAAGENAAVEAAIKAVRPGGTVILAGIPRDDRTSFQASEARRKGLTIKLVRRMKHTYPRSIALALSGKVDLPGLVSHTFPLEEAEQAFALAASRQGLKVCLLPSG